MRLAVTLAVALAAGVSGCRRTPQADRVVLITIDTLRADRLGCYGYQRPTSPAIDRLAAEGARFSTAYATAPITAPSHASILTGLYPLRHGVRTNGAYILSDEVTTLAELLHSAGLRTAAFVGALPLDHRFGFAQGFEVYDDDFSESVLRGHNDAPWYNMTVDARERRADEVIDPATRWLEENAAEPFFLWVHLFDPHHPYAPPPPFDERFYDAPKRYRDRRIDELVAAGAPWHSWLADIPNAELVEALYDGEIAYTDSQLGRLFAALDAAGVADRTAVLLTADHGEGLGEHGEYYFHGDHVYEPTARVPLIIRAPGIPAGTVSPTRARGIDLVPTILELLGLEAPTGIDGQSLVAALLATDGEAAAAPPALIEAAYRDRSGRGRFAFIADGLKIITTEPRPDEGAAAPTTECFDLGVDPREIRSICSQRRDDTDALHAAAAELRRRLSESATGDASIDLPDHVREALESLGYHGE